MTLWPGHEYKVGGKNDAQAFGGPLASMLEELKAQTGTLYYLNFAVEKGLLTAEAARRSYVSSFAWALGHISRGMYTETDAPKAYSQLAAIQVGFLMDEGAVTFDPAAAPAADGSAGALTIHFEKMPQAVDKMMKVVGAPHQGDLRQEGRSSPSGPLRRRRSGSAKSSSRNAS